MILAFLLALLAFTALLPILSPLLKSSRPPGQRAAYDQAVYRDQLQELDRDIARGLLTGAEAESARLEIQRRLLAADRAPTVAPRVSRSPALAVIVFLFVGCGSVAVYLTLGAPGLPDIPFASRPRMAERPDTAPLREAAGKLAERLRQNPSDAQGWLLFGRSLAMLEDWDKAEGAYRQAMSLGANGVAVQADHAETLVMQARGTVTPAAADAFRKVLAIDPDNAMARYYLATAQVQAGEPRKAIDGFQGVLGLLPADSPLREQIGQRIAETAKAAGLPVPELAKGTPGPGPGPSADAVANAANLPDAQREAMIRGMVAKLAAKQDADPGNLDGWLRLGRAYAVLHEDDKAVEAFRKAAALKPDDPSIPLEGAQALLAQRKPTEKIPPHVVDLLKRAAAQAPNDPAVLWYLGIAAAQDGQTDAARGYWQTLVAELPEGSEDRKMIQSALNTLAKR